MRNCCQILLLAFTVLCFTSKDSVYCTYYDEDVKYDYPFNVDENEVQVEKLVIKYTRTLPRPKNKFTKIVDKMIDVVSELTCPDTGCESDLTESSKIEDVCLLTKRNKLFLCRAILKLNYFGFQFDMERNEDVPCHRHKISLRRHPIRELATNELTMFPCPPLKYVDLTTDETIFLLVKYFISSTHKPQSFFLYIQEDPKLPIYPHKFASQLYFSQLHLMRNGLMYDERPDQLEAGQTSLMRSVSLTQEKVSKFVEIKKFSNAYEKFQKFYKNRIICAMPASHKIAVCRYIARQMDLKVDYRGYNEYRCRKRKVFSNPATPEDKNGHFLGSLQTVKCPALYEPNENGNKYIFKTRFITSNHLYESAAFLLQRLNLQQHEIKPEAFTFRILLRMLRKDRRRIREYTYLKEDNRKTFTTSSDSTRKRTQRYELVKRPQTPPLIIFNRTLIENSIISFVKMKQIRKPYQRFMQSNGSININMWVEREISYLCHIILQEEPYNLDYEESFIPFAHRSYIEAELIMRDAELLPSKKINARQCSPSFKSSSTFFIVGTIKKDAVIMYVKYVNEQYIIPHSYVHSIDKSKVQAALGEKNVPLISLI